MTVKGAPCPRQPGAKCYHRLICLTECAELAYDRERARLKFCTTCGTHYGTDRGGFATYCICQRNGATGISQ